MFNFFTRFGRMVFHSIDVFFHLLVWLALAMTVKLTSGNLRGGVEVGRLDSVPFRLNPSSFDLFLVIIAIVASLLVFLILMRNRMSLILKIITVSSCFVMFTLGAITCLYPSSGSVYSREIVGTVSNSTRGSVFALPVFFQNRSDELDAGEKVRLTATFDVFRQCESGALFVRGFASSLGFNGFNTEQSRELNLQLANRRAESVKRFISAKYGMEVKIWTWKNYEEMVDERRIRDISVNGTRDIEQESKNRRAEIFWNNSKCLLFGI